MSLLFSCPAHKKLSNCPLSKIREQHDIASRILWLKQLDSPKLRQLLHHHLECFKT